jgi:hydroxymethylglutaryl-CoA synthase
MESFLRGEVDLGSSHPADRNEDWKFGFVATRDTATGTVEMPPARMSQEGGALEQVPMAEVRGTVATFTIDRMAYSPSPPIVFGIVDFDGGGRLPIELADASPNDVTIGARVEMTFRRLGSADGISNYFWKARLMRTAVPTPAATTPVTPADSATTPTKP